MNTTKSIPATYGHGTHNDFVIIFDPDDQQSVTTAQTQAICNRQTGIGADGLIRILKREGKWFMITEIQMALLLKCAATVFELWLST